MKKNRTQLKRKNWRKTKKQNPNRNPNILNEGKKSFFLFVIWHWKIKVDAKLFTLRREWSGNYVTPPKKKRSKSKVYFDLFFLLFFDCRNKSFACLFIIYFGKNRFFLCGQSHQTRLTSLDITHRRADWTDEWRHVFTLYVCLQTIYQCQPDFVSFFLLFLFSSYHKILLLFGFLERRILTKLKINKTRNRIDSYTRRMK